MNSEEPKMFARTTGEPVIYDVDPRYLAEVELKNKVLDKALTMGTDMETVLRISAECLANGTLTGDMMAKRFWIQQAKKALGIDYKVGLENE